MNNPKTTLSAAPIKSHGTQPAPFDGLITSHTYNHDSQKETNQNNFRSETTIFEKDDTFALKKIDNDEALTAKNVHENININATDNNDMKAAAISGVRFYGSVRGSEFRLVDEEEIIELIGTQYNDSNY